MEHKNSEKNILDIQNFSEYRMLYKLSWPVVLSLIAQGLYNLVDSIFLSYLGEEVISAVSISYVMQSLATSLFSGIAIGMNAIITKAIGASDFGKTKRAIVSGVFVQLLLVIVFMFFGMFFVSFFFSWTTDNSSVIKYGIEYLKPQMILIVVMATQILFERMLQSTGVNKYLIFSQVVGSVVNIIFDLILIFGLCGFKKLGVAGAAYATIIGQASASLVAIACNIKKNKLLFSGFNKFPKININDVTEIIRLGIPSSAAGLTMSIGNYFINRILIGFSAAANATFGFYAKLQSFAHLPTQGINSGLITMVAFFYGQKNIQRVKKSLRASFVFIEVWYSFVFILLFFFPLQLLSIFETSDEIKRMAIPCFRIIGLTYIISGIMTGISSFFQAIEKPEYSFISFFIRQICVRVPVAYYFASFGDVNLIWWSWVVSEIISDVVMIFVFVKVYKKFTAEISGNINN